MRMELARDEGEVDEGPPDVLNAYVHCTVLPANRQGIADLNHLSGAPPSAFIFGGWWSVKVDKISELEVQLFHCESCFGLQCSLYAILRSGFDELLNCDFTHPHMVSRAAWNPSREIIQHRFTQGFQVTKDWRCTPEKPLIRSGVADSCQRVLGKHTF